MNRRIWVLTALLVTALALMLAGPLAPGVAQAQDGGSRLRVVHAVPGAPEIDVYVDGALVARGLAYGEVTPHLTFTAGAHDVAVVQAGTDASGTPLASASATLAADLAFSLVVQGTPDQMEMAQYEDILDPLEPGMARLTAVNAVADSPALDILTTEGGPLLQGVSYSVQYGTINIPTGLDDLVVVPAGGEVDSALATIGEVPLVSGTLYTFLFLGTVEGSVAPSTLVLATPLNSSPDEATVRARIAHGSPDAPAVDVYAGDLLIAPSIALGQMTGHIPLPAGDTTLSLRPAGAAADETPLLTADVTLDAGTPAVTVAVTGQSADGSLAFQVFPDDVAAVTPETAQIVVINAVPGATVSASLSGAGETELVSDVAADAQAEALAVEPGTYRLVASVDTGGEQPVSVVTPEQDVLGGMIYTVLVYGGGPDEVPVDARVADTVIEVTTDSLPGGAVAVAAAPETTEEAAEAMTEEAPEAAPTEAPAEVSEVTPTPAEAAEVTPTPPAEVAGEVVEATATPIPPAAPTQSRGPLAYVVLDPGANLHCRQYPSSQAFSLGLIPSGSQLLVLGRVGAPEPLPEPDLGVTPDVEPTPTPTPEPTEEITTAAQMWLMGEWTTQEVGTLNCWISAGYLRVEWNGRVLDSIETLMTLPEVPSNQPGEVVVPGTGGTPQAPAQPAAQQPSGIVALVTLEPGSNLNMRDRPAPDAFVVRGIPGGATLTVTGRNGDGTWLQATYSDAAGSSSGWVAAYYVYVSENGQAYDVMRLPNVWTEPVQATEEATEPAS